MGLRGAAGGALAIVVLSAACSYQMPAVEQVSLAEPESSVVTAADGTVITLLHGEENRESVPLGDVPRHVREAVLTAEDRAFYEHRGVSVRGLLRAARRNVTAGEVEEGGSTITQQYVKTAVLEEDEQTLSRKIREALLALSLERTYTKHEILELYLNTVYFGRGAYGVEAAAKQYFGKRIVDVSLAEGAFLATLIRAPEAIDPWSDPGAAVERRNELLERMATEGVLDAPLAETAMAEPLQLADPFPPVADRYAAAYFVEAVRQLILDDPLFGPTRLARSQLLHGGGLRIETTVDLRVQAKAEEAAAAVVPAPGQGPAAAIVAIEPSTGYVRAMVGGHDFFAPDPVAKFNLALQGGRQAGSSFKPLVLAAALEHGLPLTTQLPAPAAIDLDLPHGEVWHVRNYDDSGGGGGRVDLLEATVQSYNTVYAQLIMQLGADRAVEAAARYGVRSPLEAVPSAVLGANSVSVLDMASAFATFAARGAHLEPALVTRVLDRDGAVLFEHTPQPVPAMDPVVADSVTAVLEQAVQRGTGVRADIQRPAAGKTGTAQEWRDAWFVGYTPDLATAVWVGFPEGQVSMRPPATPIRVVGGSWPAEIWNRFMSAALDGVPPRPFVPPPPGVLPAPPTGR